MLVEPNNHQVNAAKWAIQMFKDHFVSALATTDSKFPLQLWDHLAPHSQLMKLYIVPMTGTGSHSHHLLAKGWFMKPPSHVPRGAAGVPTRGTSAHLSITTGARISGSVKLFPQHCQVPYLMWNEHLQEVITELVMMLNELPPKKRATAKACIWQSRNTSTNANSPYSQMVAPPWGFAMPAVHSPTRTKVGTKSGGQQETLWRTKGGATSYQNHRCPHNNDSTKFNSTKAVKKHKAIVLKRSYSCQTRNNIPSSIPPMINMANQRPVISTPPSTTVAMPARWSSHIQCP